MHRIISTGLLSAALMFGASSQAAPIVDSYIGGAEHGYGDIIGTASVFDVRSFDITRSGSHLHVVIDTMFAGNAGVYPSLTNTAVAGGRGIGYGDLFLGGDWTPYGAAPYKLDNGKNGTHWTYGLSLDNRWSNTGGTAQLYALNGVADAATNNPDALLTNSFLSAGVYRDGQVMAVNRASSTAQYLLNGTWSVDRTNHLVSFDFDVANTALANDSTLALHWGMTCGNDVIEGAQRVPVPAPGAVSLIALALLRLRCVRRG